MKRRFFVLSVLFTLFSVSYAQDKDFSIRLNPDYFNPIAPTYEWTITYNRELPKGYCINIQIIQSTFIDKEFSIRSGQQCFYPDNKTIRFYIGIANNATCEYYFMSPKAKNGWVLGASYRMGTEDFFMRRVIDVDAGQHELLLAILPQDSAKLPDADYMPMHYLYNTQDNTIDKANPKNIKSAGNITVNPPLPVKTINEKFIIIPSIIPKENSLKNKDEQDAIYCSFYEQHKEMPKNKLMQLQNELSRKKISLIAQIKNNELDAIMEYYKIDSELSALSAILLKRNQ